MPRFRIILIPAIRLSGLDGDRSGLPTPSDFFWLGMMLHHALSGIEPSSLGTGTPLHIPSSATYYNQASTENWLRRMESNHRKLVYETNVNTNSLRRKSPGDLYRASRSDTLARIVSKPQMGVPIGLVSLTTPPAAVCPCLPRCVSLYRFAPTVLTRDGNRTRVPAVKGRRTYPYATPAYILSRKRPRIIFYPHPV